MADILIVAATNHEVASLSSRLKNAKPGKIVSVTKGQNHNIHVLITGPGIAATIYHLTKAFDSNKYQLAINIGICGSMISSIKPVRVLNVTSDQFGDFGAEEGNSFLDSFELGFENANTFPFIKKQLHASFKKKLMCLKAIPSVTGITLQKTTGTIKTKKMLLEKYGEVVESMEGAAFFYVCKLEKINCLQIRAVSNEVEKRNRGLWKIKEAIDALDGFTGLLIMELNTIKL